ncbi:hypothetical protein [Rhodobacteraceae bacterium W635]|uniref:hypothetical protein n=1 Tax=Nioella halotolerans TaxID=2303578 RepID=UPI0011C14FAF
MTGRTFPVSRIGLVGVSRRAAPKARSDWTGPSRLTTIMAIGDPGPMTSMITIPYSEEETP